MLGAVARFGAAKGMVRVPNFSGLNSAAAAINLASAGLVLDPLSKTINTNNSLQSGVVLGQFPAANTLVDYDTRIIINLGNFVADTVTVSDCQNYGATVNDPDYCSGITYVYGSARTKRRKTITTTNNITGTTTTAFDNTCADSVVSRGSEIINGQCGYVAPPTTCTAVTNYGAYTACDAEFRYLSAGTKARTVSGTNTNCSTFSYTEYASCCQEAYQLPWSGWTPLASSNIYESRTTMFQNTSCTRYRVYQSRCRTTTTITYGGCGSNKKRIQTTKVKDLCTNITTTTTASVPCNAV
jgi:hypothetical protein